MTVVFCRPQGGGGLSEVSGIPESLFTAKGDLIIGAAASDAGVLSTDGNNKIMVSNDEASLGVEWVYADFDGVIF